MRYDVIAENTMGEEGMFSFNHGCWGKATISNINQYQTVKEIRYHLSEGDVYSTSLAKAFMDKFGWSFQEFAVKLAEEVFSDNIKWKADHTTAFSTTFSFEIDPEMPRNYLMNYLFGFRMSFTAPCILARYLLGHGIRSLRKCYIASQIVTAVAPTFEKPDYSKTPHSLCCRSSSGTALSSNWAVLEDLKRVYRQKPLNGPYDTPWKDGGGYRSGASARTIQLATSSVAKKNFELYLERRKEQGSSPIPASQVDIGFFKGPEGKAPMWVEKEFGFPAYGYAQGKEADEGFKAFVNMLRNLK